ncbi:GNAT family N-acetyltransferase [Alkalicoccus luteus]|uniref:GNAT family N-acetyltransferase n=1 Tax=Alkalicoccus luteus TaxID=1237094 RepID=A0A969TUF7_9BACI|nr:GNAT family N-acetyltransferase [Alkalicoccus luteus]NJP38663.1 GNAT family N-acetyltransferase [Alkalicoccus luteus]
MDSRNKTTKVSVIQSEQDLERAFSIRRRVFIDEQHVPPEDEFDEHDTLTSDCVHVLAEADGEAAGTGRMRRSDTYGKLERICMLPDCRGRGIGQAVIKALEQEAVSQGLQAVKLHGQTHAEGFYQKLGYETVSDVFMEDGIPHIVMTKQLKEREE